MYAPSPWAMNTGSAPTDLHARTGEFTPPGITARARSKIAWLRWIDIAGTYTIVVRGRHATTGLDDGVVLGRVRTAQAGGAGPDAAGAVCEGRHDAGGQRPRYGGVL